MARYILESRPLVYLGTISYGIYVYQGIVPELLTLAGWHLPEYHTVAALLILPTITIPVAALSWHLFEKPINSLKRHVPYPQTPRANTSAAEVSAERGRDPGRNALEGGTLMSATLRNAEEEQPGKPFGLQRCSSPVVEEVYTSRLIPKADGSNTPMNVYIPARRGITCIRWSAHCDRKDGRGGDGERPVHALHRQSPAQERSRAGHRDRPVPDVRLGRCRPRVLIKKAGSNGTSS